MLDDESTIQVEKSMQITTNAVYEELKPRSVLEVVKSLDKFYANKNAANSV